MNIALVTDSVRFALTHDDAPLVGAFARLGDLAVPVDWADPVVDWTMFDAIAIRSPWDYHERWAEFDRWLAGVEHLPLWNPARILRWNLTKTYLLELEAAGLPVIPSVRLAPGAEPDLADAVERWGEIVVKPEVGGGGAWTWRANAASRREVEHAIRPRIAPADGPEPAVGFLVQPFVPEILQGEWSLVYLDGEYSHAVQTVANASMPLVGGVV